jgi:4-diphosphocytidyl-2-C-methyl-D-erythritol kinase
MWYREAFAKINLDLRILGVHDDGYHELSTVFQTIALSDTLRGERIDSEAPFALVCNDPAIPTDSGNLVTRAARALWRVLGRDGEPRGVRLELVKAIPAAAGLGGGSADAAVALGMLAEAWSASLPEARLHEIAVGLGADVPFFLVGGTAEGRGRGDRLRPWPDVPALEAVVAVPPFGVSTADAYRWFDASGAACSAPARPPAESSWRDWLASCRNDLAPAVTERHPVLAALETRLRRAGAVPALMSGSGSAVFGLFESAERADAAAVAVADDGVRAVRTRTLSRVEYQRRAVARGGQPGLPGSGAIV